MREIPASESEGCEIAAIQSSRGMTRGWRITLVSHRIPKGFDSYSKLLRRVDANYKDLDSQRSSNETVLLKFSRRQTLRPLVLDFGAKHLPPRLSALRRFHALGRKDLFCSVDRSELRDVSCSGQISVHAGVLVAGGPRLGPVQRLRLGVYGCRSIKRIFACLSTNPVLGASKITPENRVDRLAPIRD